MDFTGERFVPELDEPEISHEHWHRYQFAADLAAGKTILDIGCGEGYGAAFLATKARRVIGIDQSIEAIIHAAQRYQAGNLAFTAAAAQSLPIRSLPYFDVVTLLEVLEHLPSEVHRPTLAEVKRVLRPGGILLVSTPNKALYSDLPKYRNPFHRKEFYQEEFRALLREFFKDVRLLGQTIYTGSHVWPLEEVHDQLVEFGLQHTTRGFSPAEVHKSARYFLAVCCDRNVQLPTYSFAFDLSGIHLTARDRRLADAERAMEALTAQVQDKEQTVQALSAQVQDKEQTVQALTAQVQGKEQTVQALSAQVQDKEQIVQALSAQVQDKEQTVQALSAQVQDKEQTVQALSAQVQEKERAVQALTAQAASLRDVGRELEQRLLDVTSTAAFQFSSRVAWPLMRAVLPRALRRFAKSVLWRLMSWR